MMIESTSLLRLSFNEKQGTSMLRGGAPNKSFKPTRFR